MLELTQELVNDPSIVGLLSYLNTGGINALAKADAFGADGLGLAFEDASRWSPSAR